jgi:hypothetical protein
LDILNDALKHRHKIGFEELGRDFPFWGVSMDADNIRLEAHSAGSLRMGRKAADG